MIKATAILIFFSIFSISCADETLNLRSSGKSNSQDATTYGQASAKATAQTGNIALIDSTSLDYTTFLQNSIRTSNSTSLFISGSIECGLYTQTQARSKGGKKSTVVASATVKGRVLVNGVEASPGEITFCDRTQELSAIFQGLLTDAEGNSCLTTDLETGAVIIDEECLQPEEVELILSTMTATTFNFVAESVGQGIQTVEFQAKVESSTSVEGDGSASAMATIGKGAVLIEAVRLRRGDNINR